MNQAYILRRDGRDYQAPDLETLRAWARDGRVLPADMVYSPRYQSWYRARDLRELRAVLPATENVNKATARQQFWLRKGDQNYATDSLDTILRWASEGNIDPDDYIYHPSYGKWFRAGDSPQLASRFPAAMRRRNEQFVQSAPVQPVQPIAMPMTPTAPLEDADSVARTVVDMSSEDVRSALLAGMAPKPTAETPVAPTPTAETPLAPKPLAPKPLAPKPVGPKPVAVEPVAVEPVAVEPVAVEPVAVEPVAVEPVAVEPVAVEPVAVEPVAVEPVAVEPVAPKPVSSPAVAVEPESLPPAEAAAPEPEEPPELILDEDARFEDTLGLLKLFYDVARVFVVTKDIRPGENMESDCRLPSTGDDFRGEEKREIYALMAQRMRGHLEGDVAEAAELIEGAENQAGYALMVARAEALVYVFEDADGVIGVKPPERFVIGNTGRPKMTPAEEEAMLRIDAALTALISVRKR